VSGILAAIQPRRWPLDLTDSFSGTTADQRTCSRELEAGAASHRPLPEPSADPPPFHAVDLPCATLPTAPSLGEHALASLFLLYGRLEPVAHPRCPGRACRRFSTAAEPPMSAGVPFPALPRFFKFPSGLRMRRTTSQAKPHAKSSPRTSDPTNSGEPYAAPPRNRARRRVPPPPHTQSPKSRPIRNLGPRLDRIPARSESSDRDPTVWDQRYRFGRYFC